MNKYTIGYHKKLEPNCYHGNHSDKKSEFFVFDGYNKFKHHQRTNGTSSWYYYFTKCSGRLLLSNGQIKVITVHNHIPDGIGLLERKVGLVSEENRNGRWHNGKKYFFLWNGK